jgi:hypothetical protein
MNYKLLNFDHGYKHPESFSIGPFKIDITEQHCCNLSHLPRKKEVTFGWDGDYNRVIKERPRKRGDWIETAEATIDDKDIESSVIYPKTSLKKSIDDLCLFLSFISGRVVTLKENLFIDHLRPEAYTDKVVHYGYFSRNNFKWNNLSKLRIKGVAGQFYNLTMAYQSHDFVAKAVHYNNALNVAYDKWYKKSQIKFIDKEVRAEIIASVQSCLNERDVKEKITDDIIKRVGNVCSPSAIFKLKHFLREIELYPRHESPEMEKKLKWLNDVRNSMAHTGMIPRDKTLSDSLLHEVTSNIIELILRIDQYYYGNNLLELKDPYLNFIKNLIVPYFYEGKFGDQLIFSEKYETYLERAKKEWIFGDM